MISYFQTYQCMMIVLSLFFYTSKSPLILHALTKTWYLSIKESLFSLNINTSLQLTPLFPSLFHEIYPLHDLDIYWQHAGISLAALTSKVKVKFGQPMKCLHLHTPPCYVASRCPNRREGRFRGKAKGI